MSRHEALDIASGWHEVLATFVQEDAEPIDVAWYFMQQAFNMLHLRDGHLWDRAAFLALAGDAWDAAAQLREEEKTTTRS